MEPRSLILLGLFAGTLAGPLNYYEDNNDKSCARKCIGSNKFKYQTGNTYEFKYGVITRTAMAGASEDHAAIDISATAQIHVISSCDLSLTLSDVTIKRSNPESPRDLEFADERGEFRDTLEANPLRFSFQDGVIDELCPEYSESKWSLNIKRGVLSMFQNTMKDLKKDERVHEEDVTGACDTDYIVSQKGWYSTNIKKSKNLLGCRSRHGYKSAVRTSSYRVPHSIQSLPLMKSVHDCDQEITSEGILKKSTCHEMHIFRPFSKDNNGAVTESNQRLELTKTTSSRQRRLGMITHRTTMRFDHTYEPRGEAQSVRDATAKLREICEATSLDIRPEVPRLFSDLVYILKNMESSWLQGVFNDVNSGNLCHNNKDRLRKFFLDALPMIESSDAIRMMRELIVRGEVTKEQSDLWLTSLAFITKPTKSMFAEIVPLLGQRRSEASLNALLSVSAMMNNYCEEKPDCLEDYEISSIISALEMNIGYTCEFSDEKQKEMILLTLRAIGNAGRSERLATSLKKCYQGDDRSTDVRIAALQAHRRMPCSFDREPIKEIFRNEETDSELRIVAYLSLMKCPEMTTLEMVRERLETEQVNQVGSFIWSHLTNLMETASPHKQAVREILEDEVLKRNFDLDKRKYSRNYEGSFFSNKYNVGAMVESNLIWSPKSFVPRSANLNLTVDLFGKSINLFELGGRIEGIEYLLESYLGPEGLFRPPGKPTEYHKSRGIKMEKLDRSKRKFDSLKEELRGSMYLRLFGNELKYSTFNGLGENGDTNGRFNFLDYLIKLSKDHDTSFTQSIMFLDSSLIIPTSSGIPLNLTVNGTASTIVKATGSVDLRKLAASPRSLHLRGSVLPSAAVEVTSSMCIDAFVTKTGLKMTSTFHTSTALTGSLDLSRGQIFSLELDTPKQKMEVFDIKSKFFIIHDKVEKEQKMIRTNFREKKICSGKKLLSITGLEVCGEVSYPNASMDADTPYFPFTGPVTMSLSLSKRDIPNGFKIIAKRIQNKEAMVAQLALNTPGSKTDRALSVDFVLNHKDQKLEAGFTSPWRKASLKGALQNDSARKGVTLILVSDKDEYAIKSFVNIAEEGKVTTYTPSVELLRPQAERVALKGTVISEAYTDIEADLKLSGATEKTINIKGKYINNNKMKSISGSVAIAPKEVYSTTATVIVDQKKKTITKVLPTLVIKTPEGTLLALTGSADYKKAKSFKTDLTFKMDKVLERPIVIKANIVRSNNTRKGTTDVKLRGSGSLNCELIVVKVTSNNIFRRNSKGKTLSTRFAIDYHVMGDKQKNKNKNKISFSSKLIDRSTKSLNKYTANANLDVKQNPECNMAIDVDLNHNKRHSEIDMKVRHGKNVKDKKDKSQELYVSGTVNHKINLPDAKLDYSLKAIYPPKKVDYHLKGTHAQEKRYLDTTLSVKYAPGKTANASFSLKNESKRFMKLAGIFSLDYPGREFKISSDVTQTQKVDYFHSLNIQMNKGERTEISSTYRRPSSSLHEITSDIQIYQQPRMKFTGEMDFRVKKFSLASTLDREGKRYGIGLSSDVNTDMPSGKWTLDLNCPYRRVLGSLEGGKKNDKYYGKFDTSWDANNDKTQRITTDANFHLQRAWQNVKLGGSVDMTTPFEPLEKVHLQYDYTEDLIKYSSIGRVKWGGKQISSDVKIAKPVTANNFNMSAKVNTPFTGYRTLMLDIDHKFNEITGHVSTSIQENWDRNYIEASVTGHARVSQLNRDIDGSLRLKTSYDQVKSFMITGQHKDDFHKFHTKTTVELNDETYDFGNDMTMSKVGWYIRGNGKTTVTSPKCRVLINWDHSNSKNNLKSTLTTEWGFTGDRLHIGLNSDHQLGARRLINSGLVITSPWEPVTDIEVAMSHDFGDGFAKRNIYFKQEKRTKASLRYNYERKDEGVDFDFFHSNPYLDDISGKLNARPYGTTKTGHVEVTWAPRQKIMVDGSLTSQSKEYYDGELRVTTPFDGFETMIGHFEHNKVDGVYVSKAYAEYGFNKKVEVETNIGIENIKKLRLVVNTPYKEMSVFDGGLEYSGHTTNFHSEANIKIIPVLENMGIELSWNKDDRKHFNGIFRIVSPLKGAELFEVTGKSRPVRKGRTASLEIAYRKPNNKIIFDNMYDVNDWTDFKIGFTLDTPYAKMRHMEADSMFLLREGTVQAEAKLKTPFKRFEDLQVALKHAHTETRAQTHVLLKYSPVKEFSAEGKFDWADEVTGEVTVKTPYENYETTYLNFNHNGPATSFRTHADLSYANKKILSDLTFTMGENMKGTFALVSPFKNVKNVQAEFNSEGKLENFKASGTLTFGEEPQLLEASLSHKKLKKVMKVDFDLKTPYLKDIKLSVNHNGKAERFSTIITGSSGTEYVLDTKTTFNSKRRHLDIGYVFENKGQEFKLQFKGQPEDFNADLNGVYDNKVINLTTSFNHDGDAMSGVVDIKTEYEGYRNLVVSFDHTGSLRSFTSNAQVKLMNGAVYTGAFKSTVPNVKNVDVRLELYIPLDGSVKKHLLAYEHAVTDTRADITTEIIYLGSNRLAGTINVDLSDKKAFSIKLESPFENYKIIVGSGSYGEAFKVHKVDGKFKVGENIDVTVTSSLDLSSVPVLFAVTVLTPYTGYETLDLAASHQGDFTNFRTSATFQSPKTKKIAASTFFRRFGPSEMEGEASFTSSFTNIENIKLELKKTVRNGFKEKRAVVGWAENKEIIVDGSYKVDDNWRGQEVNGLFNLKTPFDVLKDVQAKLDFTRNNQIITNVLSADYNGKSYLDIMSRFTHNVEDKKIDYTITVKAPRPMLFWCRGHMNNDEVEGDFYANWAQNQADSNFEVKTLFKNVPHPVDLDRSYLFKIVHPARTIGFEGNFMNNDKNYKSQALLTWDEKKGNTFSYDVQFHNKSTRYRQDHDTSVKIGVPMRVVKLTNGYTNGRGVQSYDTTVFWDAERDESKQIGGRLEVQNERPLKKYDVSLLMPSIDKTYKLSTEYSKDVGSSIFYGKSEFSYNTNPNHIISLSTKLEDVAVTQNGKNYSLSIQLSHPATGVNVEVTSHAGRADDRISTGTEVLYLAADKMAKNFALRGEIDRLRKVLNFEAISPIKSVEIRGEATPGVPMRLRLQNTYDQTKHVTADLLLDSNRKEMDFTMNYNPDDPHAFININGNYVNSTFIQAEIFRQRGSERFSVGSVAIRLNTSNILHTRFTWSPSIIPELQQLVSNKLQVYTYTINNIYNGAAKAVGNEVRMKFAAISNEIKKEMEPIMKFVNVEMKSMEGQLNTIGRELRRFYDRNDLHIKDMSRTINEMFDEVFTAYTELLGDFKIAYSQMEEVMDDVSNVIQRYPVRERYQELVQRGMGLIRKYQQIITARINDLMYRSDEYSAALYAKYRATTRHLQRKLHETTRIITDHPQFKLMREKYEEMKNKLDYFPDVDFSKLAGAVDSTIQSSLSPQIVDTYKSIVYNTRSVIQAQLQDLMKQKEFKQMYDLSKEMHAQAVWAYKYMDVDRNFKYAMVKAYDLTKEILFEELSRLREGLVDLKKSRMIVFDTEHGEVQFELYLPISLKSLQDPPHLGIKRYIRKIQNFAHNYLPTKNSTFWDMYYNSRFGTHGYKSWLPPFRAYASVIGKQHFVTFDQRHFDFAGRCSYVLARDMVDDNFTVVLNYDKNSEPRSIMVLMKGLTIEVSNDNKISANDRQVELPFVSESVAVVNKHGIISITNGHGLSVDCNTKHEIYTVGLPGWYYGKVAGLLGTYDNEAYNDMTTAEHRMTNNVQQFASSWEIGRRRCVTDNVARFVKTVDNAECVKLFSDDSSPFRPCFQQVKPEAFKDICNINAKRMKYGVCRSARQYVGECRNRGIAINMPKDCILCDGPDGEFKQGSRIEFSPESKKPTPSSADIVFIVEEKQCNIHPVRVLPKLVTLLETQLHGHGINRNRYGLIGYGGDYPLDTEHVNTMESGEFADASVFLKGTENLRLSNSTQNADNLAAIRLATGYPFRIGVSKILVLLPCSVCTFDLKHLDMDNLLKTHGFNLHVVRDENFTLPEDAIFKGTTIYGLDSNKVHSTKDETATQLFNTMTKPVDICTKLALHTNGSIFDASNIVTRRTRVQREAISTFVNRVREGAKPPSCQICECRGDDQLNGRTVCKPCEHSFTIWDYLPKWWIEPDTTERGIFEDQIQGIFDAVKKSKTLESKSL